MNLRSLPKVELHRHLECSLRFSTLLELARATQVDIPADLAQQKQKFLVTEPMLDLKAVLEKFLASQRLLDSEEILTRITFEAIEDACNEGIRILELRYAPTYVQNGHPHLSFEKIHQAICKGMKLAENLPIAVGLICIVQRTLSVDIAHQVIDFAVAHKNTFVGVDLADNEVGFDSKPFASAFAKAKAAGLGITIHAGEANVTHAARYVKDAIEVLGATRIGHGVQIYRDAEIMEYVKQKKIPLELCPTSNYLTQAVQSVQDHPIKYLKDKGIFVTINSDDPGIFDIDLTHEYMALERLHQFSEADFNECNDTAASVSFIAHKLKQKFWPRTIKEFL